MQGLCIHARHRFEAALEIETTLLFEDASYPVLEQARMWLRADLEDRGFEILRWDTEHSVRIIDVSKINQLGEKLARRAISILTDGLPPITKVNDESRMYEKCKITGHPSMRQLGYPSE